MSHVLARSRASVRRSARLTGGPLRGYEMPASVGYLVIDSEDPGRITPFWCGLLDVEVESTLRDGQFVVLTPTQGGLTVGFQRIGEPKSGKNRLHLDLVVEDLDEATSEIVALGGRWTEDGNTRELEGFKWRCMADPEGNEFDIDVLPPN
jgi:predicted enzyme related to lactoylglutathione lyase